jgi:hypothetical protein
VNNASTRAEQQSGKLTPANAGARAVLFDAHVSSPWHFGSAHRDGLIATPISRPKSRHEISHRWIAVAMAFSSPLQSSEILLLPGPHQTPIYKDLPVFASWV